MKRSSVPGPSISIARGRSKVKWSRTTGHAQAQTDWRERQLDETARLLRLLGDPTRLRLLLLLRRVGDLPVYELAALLEMHPSAVSHALRLLRAHDVVRSRREGKMMVYFMRSEDVAAILDRFVP